MVDVTPPRRTRANWLLGLLVVVALTGCGTGEAEPGRIGEAVEAGGFEFVVTAIECGVPEVGDDSAAGTQVAVGEFCLLHLTIANTGDQSAAFHATGVELVDTEGTAHRAAIIPTSFYEQDSAWGEPIEPGATAAAVAVFDVPVGTSITTARLSADATGSRELAEFDLT